MAALPPPDADPPLREELRPTKPREAEGGPELFPPDRVSDSVPFLGAPQ